MESYQECAETNWQVLPDRNDFVRRRNKINDLLNYDTGCFKAFICI